ACIQMALEYYGEKKTQKEINKAGNPEQPDLYMDDIDVALKKLSVKYHSWPLSNNNIEEFVDWIKLMLNQMYPVVCGVKIYPDEHPDWFLDHFVLIVGYNKNGFIVNTNIYGQKLISYKNLMFKKNGFSFCNEYRKYFARAITGVK
ncbi:MAG: hypothetical protein GX640_23300, partial [Fibrobacter sp.]|nr:hypothetical protein [Fibrobacter sp.]